MADANKSKNERIDPEWPHEGDEHPVSEFLADRQGPMSPFGDVTFPLSEDVLPYEHPHTEINK
ncbi:MULTISPECIES: hypothetical protein [Actinopolyspora]|uniref:Uncharacterized protein n=1 Tax=Actinopolyspora saharensis TaxID=995062 RepID=A0A1H1EVK7_9ACTN|nr:MULTISPECIES: hypothetical protein [Actinopolyspora]NHD18247.1 hypothetical protein [Actinopolyspora sp. BKK2]NHE77074.1 hypothetical protein [Actinopolyspora sp. BKK1]SDQ92765.1 hypothetical protein SAMN04489718_2709 [Actinopolyspora saharensis]